MLPQPFFPYSNFATCSAGTTAASKMRVEVFDRLKKMLENLDTYAGLFGYEKGQLEIKLFEGLRTTTTQALLFYVKVGSLMFSKWMSYSNALQEAALFVSPVKDNIPVHSTGAAIDIRLWDSKSQDFIDMGAFGALSSKEKIPTFSEYISDEQKKNRLLFLIAATSVGLANYSFEWWHFSYGDRYWCHCYDTKDQEALYGQVHDSSFPYYTLAVCGVASVAFIFAVRKIAQNVRF